MISYSTEAFFEVWASCKQLFQLSGLFLYAFLLYLLLIPRKGSDHVLVYFVALDWLWARLVFMHLHLILLNWAARIFEFAPGIHGLFLFWSDRKKVRLCFNEDADATPGYNLRHVICVPITYPLAQISAGIVWMAVQYASILSGSTMLRYQCLLLHYSDRVSIHPRAILMACSIIRGANGWNSSLWRNLSLSLMGPLTVSFSNGRSTNAPQSSD